MSPSGKIGRRRLALRYHRPLNSLFETVLLLFGARVQNTYNHRGWSMKETLTNVYCIYM